MRNEASASLSFQQQPQETSSPVTWRTWLLQQILQEGYTFATTMAVPVAAALTSIVLYSGHGILLWDWIIVPLGTFALRIVGIVLGIGLGLGLATHVYDRLEAWHVQHEQQQLQTCTLEGISPTRVTPNLGSSVSNMNSSHRSMSAVLRKTSNWQDDETAYSSLMSSAGYDVSDHMLRGQVVRRSTLFLKPNYPYTHVPEDQQMGPKIMKEQWPYLPLPIAHQLGRWIEHIVRDYVACWYCIIDAGCPYENEKERRTREGLLTPVDNDDGNNEHTGSNKATDVHHEEQGDSPTKSNPRAMIFRTSPHRPIPLMTAMYHSLAIIIGNLSTRVEHVNIFSLVLLKWTKVLSQTLKTYRQLRRLALTKNGSTPLPLQQQQQRTSFRRASSIGGTLNKAGGDPLKEGTIPEDDTDTPDGEGSTTMKPTRPAVSEMAMAKEFLLAGKLHRALTFGMDVPSLLFADPSGKECGVDNTNSSPAVENKEEEEEETLSVEQVLEERLFQAKMLNECEMDYNRVLGSRLCRALLPRAEFTSPIIRTLITEMLAGCVLMPMMSCFSPDYLNSWICSGVESMTAVAQDAAKENDVNDAKEEETSTEVKVDEGLMRGWNYDAPAEPSVEMPLEETSAIESDRRQVGEINIDSTEEALENDEEDDKGVEVGVELTVSQVDFLSPVTKEDGGADDDERDEELHDEEIHEEAIHEEGVLEEAVLEEGILEEDVHDGDYLEEHLSAHDENVAHESDDEASSQELTGETHGDAHVGPQGDEAIISDEVVDMEEAPVFESHEDVTKHEASGDFILPLLTMSVIDLQRYVDFDECREAKKRHQQIDINWDEDGCREAVRQLVLVLEAALIHGRRERRVSLKDVEMETACIENSESDLDLISDEPEAAVEVLIPQFHSSSFPQMLMELTSDIQSFEEWVIREEKKLDDLDGPLSAKAKGEHIDAGSPSLKPSPTEVSTLRTLIAAWLHTGQAHRTVSVLARAQRTILESFYDDHAFLRRGRNAIGFVRQLRALDGVEILVDTSLVLASKRLDVGESNSSLIEEEISLTASPPNHVSAAPVTPATIGRPFVSGSVVQRNARMGPLSLSGSMMRTTRLTRFMSGGAMESVKTEDAVFHEDQNPIRSSVVAAGFSNHASTPRYLDFHKNRDFASSLRSERERRMQSWMSSSARDVTGTKIVMRTKGFSDDDITLYRDLHLIARTFYSSTNMLAIRDAARRIETDPGGETSPSNAGGKEDASGLGNNDVTRMALLTIEMSCARRRIEIPDDDSSFLVRGQPRTLNPIGVHRDQNHDQSFKCYTATYEEPAIRPGSSRYTGGRYIRRCQLRYYPSSRTATIVIPKEPRHLDQRKGGAMPTDNKSFLSGDFLRERHLCQKWIPRGATPRSSSILSSTVMEPSDFSSVPRAGKTIDFLYRMPLFENPMVSLSGKVFTIHDSQTAGTHRADASALEISDASLSVALLMVGIDWAETPGKVEMGGDERAVQSGDDNRRLQVEMGADGYPIVWMRFTSKQGDQGQPDIKAYRASYLRAALMITSSRYEAQQQSLVMSIREGSARNATRARTESLLLPTATLLEFATSTEREKQSILLRDLKLGMNHIDREQLRRNGLLNPRYPTTIHSLTATVEGSMQVKDAATLVPGSQGTMVLYKIRCAALVELSDMENGEGESEGYRTADDSNNRMFREEWVVYRPFRDFNTLHKHLKSQVAASETSASAGARLVGAATAAFVAGVAASGGNRRRKALIPSLGQATKAGALGVTRKSLEKRRIVLEEYLQHFLSQNHILRLSSEILQFLGANHPLPPDVRSGGGIALRTKDSLGRTEMRRTVVRETSAKPEQTSSVVDSPATSIGPSVITVAAPSIVQERSMRESTKLSDSKVSMRASSPNLSVVAETTTDTKDTQAKPQRLKEADMSPVIKSKIDQVPLSLVRNAIFELIRSQFDFDNASFFRNQMLSAIKTMSFAVTTGGEFRKTLYDLHVKKINVDSLADWIKFGLDTLWPDGVFKESSPELSPEESKDLAAKSKEMLPATFPDQLRTILGQEISQDGLDMLHEMLQNRVVTKSLAYMLFDLLWLELFPELQDILTCGSALELE